VGSGGGNPRVILQRQVVSATANGAVSVFAADLDGDGDMDLLSASAVDDKIAWYESLGGKHPAFVEHTISNRAREANSVSAADVDGDGDTDVLSASCVDDKIAWYENVGGSPSVFVERILTEDPDGVPGPLRGFADGTTSVFAADLDGDGDTDLLSTSSNDDKVAWYENKGGSPPQFIPREISVRSHGNRPTLPGAIRGAKQVFATDLDGDGDVDLLAASFDEDTIEWFVNKAILPEM